MDAVVKWTGPGTMAFLAETGSGHLLAMDGAVEGGGRDLAPRPMETVLAGAGACSAYDVVAILVRSGQDVRGCEVAMHAERAATDPKVFTRIEMRYRVRGRGLKPNLVQRAVELSRDKYCSAIAMLARTAEIAVDWEVLED